MGSKICFKGRFVESCAIME